jgi:hypothetical protein
MAKKKVETTDIVEDEVREIPIDGVLRDEDGDPIAPNVEEIPGWVQVPPDLVYPKGGRQVTYVLFKAAWTDVPEKGDRHCVLWNLNEADEKLALKRTRGEALRTIDELAKQMVRCIDGHKSDWTGGFGPGNVDLFWNDIGAKCRQQLKNLYAKTHMFNTEDSIDFFTNCIAVRTVAT